MSDEKKDSAKVAAAKAWLDSKPDWWREAYEEANRRDQARITAERPT